MRSVVTSWLLSALLFSLSADLHAEPGRALSEAEVARRAAATSFDVSAERAELSAAIAEVDRARAAYVPKVTLTARYTRLSDPGDSAAGSIVAAPGAAPGPIAPGTPLVNVPLSFETLQNQYLLQASLLIPVSDYFLRVNPGHDAAKHGASAARASVEATRRQAATDARIAYWSWVRAKLGVTVAEQALTQSQAHLEDAKIARNVGNASLADVLRVEAQVAKSEQLLEASKNLHGVSQERVRVALHDRSRGSYQVGDDIQAPLAPVSAQSLESLVSRAVSRRPELASLRASERAQKRAASVDRAAYLPRFDLFANAYYGNPAQRSFPQRDEFKSSWDAGAQLTWVLSDVPGAAAGASAAESRARAVTARRRAAEDRIRVEVAKALGDAREADVSVRTTARALASAEEGYRVRRVLFQNGKATSVELLDAETALTSARFDAIDARIAARVARARLAYAVGDDVGLGAR